MPLYALKLIETNAKRNICDNTALNLFFLLSGPSGNLEEVIN